METTFQTLAEELHFRRTAERLHVSQARVSQAIKKQERRIGGVLFERTSQQVTLTPLGRQLHDDLRAGYDTIQAGLARATGAARGVTGTLRIGTMGAVSHLIRQLVDHFLIHNPGCDVMVPEVHFSDPFGPLRRNEADIVVLWRPVREPDLIEGSIVLTEGRALAVCAGHELARRSSISMEELADHFVVDTTPSAERPFPKYWIEAMLPARTPRGRPLRHRGQQPSTFHEVLTLVGAGQCVAPVNEHAITYYSHPGVVFVPIEDAHPTDWALVWRSGAATPLGRAFAQAARDYGPATLHDVIRKADQDADLATAKQELGHGAA